MQNHTVHRILPTSSSRQTKKILFFKAQFFSLISYQSFITLEDLLVVFSALVYFLFCQPPAGELSGQVLSFAANTIYMAISCSSFQPKTEQSENTTTGNKPHFSFCLLIKKFPLKKIYFDFCHINFLVFILTKVGCTQSLPLLPLPASLEELYPEASSRKTRAPVEPVISTSFCWSGPLCWSRCGSTSGSFSCCLSL